MQLQKNKESIVANKNTKAKKAMAKKSQQNSR